MNSTETTPNSRVSSPAGRQCQVATDRTELPRGSFFTTLPGGAVETGDLVMFRIGRRTSVGRWLPDVGGFDWILQPGLLIAVDCPVWIVGKVIPIPPVKVCQSGRIKATPGSRN